MRLLTVLHLTTTVKIDNSIATSENTTRN